MDALDAASRAAAAGAAALVLDDVDRRLGISHDINMIKNAQFFKGEVARMLANKFTLADLWESTVAKHASQPSIVFEGKSLTFKQVDDEANRMANYLVSKGVKKGDIVALLMENRPEFLIIGFALNKIGAVAAYINTNLRLKHLLHCIAVATAKVLIFGTELTAAVAEVADTLKRDGVRAFSQGGAAPFAEQMDVGVARQAATFDKAHRAGLLPQDISSFIYTSGTTGLPKAVTIVHGRALGVGAAWCKIYGVTERDRIYTVLPLYHSAGGGIGLGMMTYCGAALVLRRKFSAKHFMSDIREYRCTVFQYIGELCRYLLAVEPSPLDRHNELRLAIGNGLRPDIWEQFQARFNITYICEFYGSTEGNLLLFNKVDQSGFGRGAIGRMGYLMNNASHGRIVKFDVETEEPIRDKNGFCVVCAPNEAGELVARISDSDPFLGYYNNPEGTNKKILTNVLQNGDRFFRTGDLIRQDEFGFFYFVDRIGDTFRWKGENVSTNEVAEAISVFPGIKETNVYGVEVPGKDGRAGMAAVVMAPTTDLVALGQHAAKVLPAYAIPIFLRALPQIEITGTFKHQKVTLRTEGMDPSKVKDPLFMFNPQTKAYEPFGWQQYNQVVSGKARL